MSQNEVRVLVSHDLDDPSVSLDEFEVRIPGEAVIMVMPDKPGGKPQWSEVGEVISEKGWEVAGEWWRYGEFPEWVEWRVSVVRG